MRVQFRPQITPKFLSGNCASDGTRPFNPANSLFANRPKRLKVTGYCLQTMEISTTSSLPTVLVRPGEADRLVAGHPWLYSGSILRITAEVADGDLVQVKDHRQRFLGVGFYNSKSKISVRIIDQDRVEVDTRFFEVKIREALDFRKRHLPKATSFRVVNAESDFLSGLIVDKYEDTLVLQTSSLGMDQRKGMIVDALTRIFSPKAILERNDVASRRFEGLPEVNGILAGTLSGDTMVDLNGIKIAVDLTGGHKTGYYLDQQTNYEKVAGFARGRQTLDCFCFLGGFALHAARNGAPHVHGLDQSADAVAAASRNAVANGLDQKCAFEAVNVFDWLKAHTSAGPHEKVVQRYDLIILDPPSFTRNRASIPDALRGYKEIHLRALKLLRKNGILATFCCSHHIDAVSFQNVILDAAYDAHRTLRKIETYSQSLDHPIIPAIAETEYLKGYAFEVAQ